MQSPTISYLTKVQFGAGALSDLAEVMANVGITRPLVVTDQPLVELGFVAKLGLADPIVFADIQSNPTESSVLKGLESYREHGCNGFIALGGGSPIDAAKAMAILATHDIQLEDAAYIRGGLDRITSEMPPLIAIPTTAGTGTEVGRGSLVTMASGQKLAIISPHIIPNWSIVDPELTLNLPPTLTAATGMDALSHCIETAISRVFNPVAEGIALDGLKRGWDNLKIAFENPFDIAARSEMMMCAMQGALSFQKGLGLVHSISHPLGALQQRALHHGTLNSVLMPHVLRFNEPDCRLVLGKIGEMLGITGGVDGISQALTTYSDSMDLPLSLSAMGVEDEDLVGIEPLAVADHCSLTNPRDVTEEAVAEVLKSAF
ncbi:MAG: 4-hydroxybutyrate dehydrogenase [Planctomycetaceae bacterium]|nr:4-hydroxybutyrate dehydrogenase [Planctomycetaceae bacterium]